jgi:hypothetical protein
VHRSPAREPALWDALALRSGAIASVAGRAHQGQSALLTPNAARFKVV